MLEPGTVVCGENNESDGWKVRGLLGQGTCCEVYKVSLVNKEQCKAALKIYKDGDNYVTAHDSEALLLNLVLRVNGPCKNIVTTLWDLDHEERPCLIQELLDLDLRQIIEIAQGDGLSSYLLRNLLLDILRGINHLHKSGFIHADIKPSNLMWSPTDGCLKIIDFSLSFQAQDQVIGRIQSRAYRAPETDMWNQKIASDNPSSSQDAGAVQNIQSFQSTPCSCGSLKPINSVDSASNYCENQTDLVHKPTCELSVTCDHSETQNKECVKCKWKSDGLQPMLILGVGDVNQCQRPGKAADMWSVGCLIGEMFTGTKMFTASKLTEIQQKQRMGWSLSACILEYVKETFKPQPHRTDMEDAHVAQLLDLTSQLLSVDPSKRLTAENALKHPFFSNEYSPTFSDMCTLSSPVLRLLNVVDEEDLASDDVYQDLKQDLVNGFEEYGQISQCVLPEDGEGKGKVYVQYVDWGSALKAYRGLSRRHFNDHTIVLTYFPLQEFRAKNFY